MNYPDLQDYEMGTRAKIILADVMNKYLAPELTAYICNDFMHELLTAKAEALLGEREGKA